MMENVEVISVSEDQKTILRQLLELYEYDFSEFNHEDVNEYGLYGYTYLDHYWTDDTRHPFFIKVEGKFAGFILVNSYCYLAKDKNAKSIAEFFVMRKYRRKGTGKIAIKMIFDQFQGEWEVLQHENNIISKSFWLNVIEEYTSGKYIVSDVKTQEWDGTGILFNNSVS
ncbi:GNAT family N-acetyltransferase [Paenibacillus antarcticus]|nr:GNAT family N-acetyltransferase [Paenibacillus antarcticus]